MIDGTVLSWCEAITENRVFDEPRDAPRFRKAFATLAANCRTWPAPRDFLDAMPPRDRTPIRTPLITDNASTQRVHDHLAKFRTEMGYDFSKTEEVDHDSAA